MRCFHEIQNEINIRCPVEGPSAYRRTYILPLIEQTRDIVVDKCDMSPTYQHYFISASPPGERHRTTTTVAVAAALVAFLLARLNGSSRCSILTGGVIIAAPFHDQILVNSPQGKEKLVRGSSRHTKMYCNR